MSVYLRRSGEKGEREGGGGGRGREEEGEGSTCSEGKDNMVTMVTTTVHVPYTV